MNQNSFRNRFGRRRGLAPLWVALLLGAALFCSESGDSPAGGDEAAPGTPRIVDGDGLRLRNRPNRDGAIMGVLYRGDTVHELSRSAKPETIAGREAPWVQVRTGDGTVGWVFGGFLKDAPGAKNAAPATTSPEPKPTAGTEAEAKEEPAAKSAENKAKPEEQQQTPANKQ